MRKINIQETFAQFDDYWSPKIVETLKDVHIKFAKFKGEFVWHMHENEEELFLVIKGSLIIELRNETISLKEGEFVVIPKGVEHKPIAEEEVQVILIEPKGTINTGNKLIDEKTQIQEEYL